MAILGRSYTRSNLRPPQVLAAPAPPTQQQQTVTVSFACAVGRVAYDRRRFPRQGWGGDFAKTSAASDGGTVAMPTLVRLLGPKPPQVVTPMPTQRLQTIVARLAVDPRRRSEVKRFPKQWIEGNSTKTTGFAASTFGVLERGIGPDPPSVVLAGPTQRMQTIVVRGATLYRRVTETRRFPKQGYEPAVTKTSGSATTTMWIAERSVGPDPPGVVLPVPTQLMQTVRVSCVGVRTRVEAPRRAAHYVLYEPAVVAAPLLPPVATTIESVLQAVARRVAGSRRQPHWQLAVPATLANPPTQDQSTVRVALVAVATRGSLARRPARSLLARTPVVLAPPPVQQTILVSLAGRSRIERPRRGTGYAVQPPVVVTAASAFSGPSVLLARLQRRPRVRSVLGVPVAAQAAAATPPPVQTTNVARQTRPRHTRSFLGQPTASAAAPVVSSVRVVRPVARPRRPTRSFLYQPAALAPVATTIAVVRSPVRPRRVTRSFLHAPAVTAAAAPVVATLTVVHAAARHSRPTRSSLMPPATLVAAAAPVVATLTIAKAPPRARRLYRSALARPAVVAAAAQPLARLSVTLTRARRPLVGHQLAPPVVVSFTPPFQPVRVVVPVRVRARPGHVRPPAPPVVAAAAAPFAPITTRRVQAPPRRVPFSRLSRPTVVLPLPTLRMQTLTTALSALERRRTERQRFPRQGYESATTKTNGSPATTMWLAERLVGPRPPTAVGALPSQQQQTVTTQLVAVRSRVELQRRVGRRRLAPPSAVAPPPSLRQQTVQVALAGRTRVEAQRRGPHWKLRGPVVVLPLPTLRVQTVQVTLAAWRQRVEDLRRGPRSRLRSPLAVLPLPTQQMQTVVVVDGAVGYRLDRLRGPTHSALRPLPFEPPEPEHGHGLGGSGFPSDYVSRLLAQLETDGLDSLDDDEVALLLSLGYL